MLRGRETLRVLCVLCEIRVLCETARLGDDEGFDSGFAR
jgi:hypothetical protein